MLQAHHGVGCGGPCGSPAEEARTPAPPSDAGAEAPRVLRSSSVQRRTRRPTRRNLRLILMMSLTFILGYACLTHRL